MRWFLSLIIVIAPLVELRAQSQIQQVLVAAQTPASSGITQITHFLQQSTDGNGFTTTAVNTTGASLIVVGIVLAQSTQATVTSSSPSNTLTFINLFGNGSGGRYAHLYYVCGSSIGGASQTFSGGLLTGTNPSVEIWAYSGTATSSCLDGTATGLAQTTNNTTIQPGSITPSQASGELLVTLIFAGTNTGSHPTAIDSSFILDDAGTTSGTASSIGGAHIIATSNTALNPTWTVSAVWPLATIMAAFKHI